ncbi:MAG: carboxymuconolactone decarboxylase family protein [Pseudomonadota bacterium]
MTTVKLMTDAEADAIPEVKAVFDDIRETRGTDFINNIWRALAFDPKALDRTWQAVKTVMAAPGELDPKVREMIYIAVSTANGCGYCVHSHTAAARAKGMTEAELGELTQIIALAGMTNQLATTLQVPTDPEFQVS